MKVPLVFCAFLITACTCGDAASDLTNATSDKNVCSSSPAESFDTLHHARGLVSTTAMYETSGDVPVLLSAFRCVVGAREPMTNVTRLLEEGSIVPQLYALIALKVMAPTEFAKRIPSYLSSSDRVHLLGGDVESLRPVSEIAKHIQQGEYSALLPSSIYTPRAPQGRIDSDR